VLPEDGDRILKNKEDGVLVKDKTIDNVQKRNICRNLVGPESCPDRINIDIAACGPVVRQ
jgi:hypothetical protein